jgi:hypothetical protein
MAKNFPHLVLLITDAMMANSALVSLNLSENAVGDEGTRIIAEALKTNPALSNIDISKNFVTSEGGGHIATALETNRSLSSLNISHNTIFKTCIVAQRAHLFWHMLSAWPFFGFEVC